MPVGFGMGQNNLPAVGSAISSVEAVRKQARSVLGASIEQSLNTSGLK
jgi:hypothetical protein